MGLWVCGCGVAGEFPTHHHHTRREVRVAVGGSRVHGGLLPRVQKRPQSERDQEAAVFRLICQSDLYSDAVLVTSITSDSDPARLSVLLHESPLYYIIHRLLTSQCPVA